MDIKMIVTDLDNTLLRRDKTISDYTVRVFKNLRERGILIAYATARPLASSAHFRAIIEPDVCIAACGAYAIKGEDELYRAAIDIDTANAVIRRLIEADTVSQLAVDAETNYFSSEPVDENWIGWVDFSQAITTDFQEPLTVRDVFKITPHTEDRGLIEEIIADYPELKATIFNNENWQQITSKEASKMAALRAVCRHLGFTPQQVVAFGDDHSDTEMLKECGVGVAMANAISACKEVSDCRAADCDEDGVAVWITKYLL